MITNYNEYIWIIEGARQPFNKSKPDNIIRAI